MTLPWGSSRFDQAAAQSVVAASSPAIQIRTASPNDLSTWAHYGNFVSATNCRAPDNTFTATGLVADAGGFAGRNTPALPDGGSSGVLVAGQHYKIKGHVAYYIPVDAIGNTGSGWFGVLVYDGVSNQIRKWFNVLTSTSAIGSNDIVGPAGAVIDSFSLVGDIANDYSIFEMEFHTTSSMAGSVVVGFSFGDADMSDNMAVVTQELFFWGFGA